MKVVILALNSAMLLGLGTISLPSYAADLPREGTYKGSYASSGQLKIIPVGKDRVLTAFSEEHGTSVTDGFLDHVTWLCGGMGNFVKGTGHLQASCVGTDQSGDQLVFDFTSEEYPLDAKSFKVSGNFTSGTGKYTGISGTGTNIVDLTFKPPADGMFIIRGEMQGNYKLPK